MVVRSRLKKGNRIALQVKTERLTPDNKLNIVEERDTFFVESSGDAAKCYPLWEWTRKSTATPSPQAQEADDGGNYSDFMRSLAAKYNNANPNE